MDDKPISELLTGFQSTWEQKHVAKTANTLRRAAIFAPMVLNPWSNTHAACEMVVDALNGRMELLAQLAQETLLDSRTEFASARFSGASLAPSSTGQRILVASFGNAAWSYVTCANFDAQTDPLDVAETLWPQAMLAICRHHWLGTEEPLTPEQSASGDFAVEGDGARSFCLGLSQMAPLGRCLLRAFEQHRQARLRICSLRSEFESALSSAESSGLCPRFLEGHGELSVVLEARFDEHGRCHIYAESLTRQSYFSSRKSDLFSPQDHSGIVAAQDIGLLSESDDELWEKFAKLCFSKAFPDWRHNDLTKARASCEKAILDKEAPMPGERIGQQTRI